VVERAEVVQRIVSMYGNPSYLEIGVDQGATFQAVKAKRKVGVDPNFKFTPENIANGEISVEYVQATTDRYFGGICLPEERFDVVYIDGLHTFEQTLRDFLNAVSRLNPRGVIIVDDILPNSYHSSLPDLGLAWRVRDYMAQRHTELAQDSTWMGDVFKLAFFIHTFMQAYSYATVADNHGQLILWHQPRVESAIGQMSMAEIGHLEFCHTLTHRYLFNLAPFEQIVCLIQSANASNSTTASIAASTKGMSGWALA
jgi:hypothetical protein